MSKILILVEGFAEQRFVKDILTPYLTSKELYLVSTLVTTKRLEESGSVFKGGIVPYERFKRDIKRLLNDPTAAIVTTMIDFYGLPKSFPGRKNMPKGSCYKQVTYIEEELSKDINHHKFLPYLALHEFEAMLFVEPEQINRAFPDTDKSKELAVIRTQFKSPEEINDDPQKAPSKRLQELFPGYQKTLHGPLVISEIGIERIRSGCPHFNAWLEMLEVLGKVEKS
jgi:hypothetical protein